MHAKLSALLVWFLAATWPLAALAQTPAAPQPPAAPSPQWYGPGPWWMWGDGIGWQYWWICPLMMLFMIVVFAAIFFTFRRTGGDGSHRFEPPWRTSQHSALQILSERFARGEIQRTEYEEKKATILSGGGG
jgi:putative membrane protein